LSRFITNDESVPASCLLHHALIVCTRCTPHLLLHTVHYFWQKLDSIEEDLEKQLVAVEHQLQQTLPDLRQRDSSGAEYATQQAEQLKVSIDLHIHALRQLRPVTVKACKEMTFQ
jgi:hypothetical protein